MNNHNTILKVHTFIYIYIHIDEETKFCIIDRHILCILTRTSWFLKTTPNKKIKINKMTYFYKY